MSCTWRDKINDQKLCFDRWNASPIKKQEPYEVIDAARAGHIACLQSRMSHYRKSIDPAELLIAAIKSGNMQCVLYCYSPGMQFPGKGALIAAFESGNLDCIQFVLDKTREEDRKISKYALSLSNFGSFGAFQYAITLGLYNSSYRRIWGSDLYNLFGEGNLPLLIYACESGCDWESELVCSRITWKTTPSCLKYLHKRIIPYEMYARYGLIPGQRAKRAHLELSEELIDKCLTRSVDNVACLKYIEEEDGLPRDICTRAALNGGIRCLKYLCGSGYPVTAETVDAACKASRAICLEYLCKLGYKTEHSAYISAMKHESIEVLLYLFHHKRPYEPSEVLIAATMSNYWRLVRLYIPNEIYRKFLNEKLYYHAAMKFKDEVMKDLKADKCPWKHYIGDIIRDEYAHMLSEDSIGKNLTKCFLCLSIIAELDAENDRVIDIEEKKSPTSLGKVLYRDVTARGAIS